VLPWRADRGLVEGRQADPFARQHRVHHWLALASLLLLQAKPVEVAALVVVVRQPVHVLRPRQAHARPIQGRLLLLRGSPRLLHEPPHRGGSSLEGVRRLAGEPPGGLQEARRAQALRLLRLLLRVHLLQFLAK